MRKDNPNITFEELEKSIRSYITDKKDLELIKRAYQYAYNMHFGVKRLTGEDYITHPLNVALILTSIHADAATLCGGLLHCGNPPHGTLAGQNRCGCQLPCSL